MPKLQDDYFLLLAPSARGEVDPNESKAMDLIRAHGLKPTYAQSFLVAKLGELLRFARKQQALSQQQAAARGGLSQAHISRLENGLATAGPTFESLVTYLGGIGFEVELGLRFKQTGTEFARLGSRKSTRKRRP